jgi:ribosome recycling factor
MIMSQDIDQFLSTSKHYMDDAIEHLSKELIKIRTGKASTSMLGGIMVDYYGNATPLNQVANVSTADARTLSIQPWEKKMLPVIERSIFEANLGMTPQNDGEFIRINIPALTEERRKELVKQAKGLAEEAKISLRNARHKMMDFIKNEVKNGYPEDLGKRKEAHVDKIVHEYSEHVDRIIEAKEKDIMTV